MDGEYDRAAALLHAKVSHEDAIQKCAEMATALVEQGSLQSSGVLGKLRSRLVETYDLKELDSMADETRGLYKNMTQAAKKGSSFVLEATQAIEGAATAEIKAQLLCLRPVITQLQVAIADKTLSSNDLRYAASDAHELADKLKKHTSKGRAKMEAEAVARLAVALDQARLVAIEDEAEAVRLKDEKQLKEEREERMKPPKNFLQLNKPRLPDYMFEYGYKSPDELAAIHKEKSDACMAKLENERKVMEMMPEGKAKERARTKLAEHEQEAIDEGLWVEEEEEIEEEIVITLLTPHIFPETEPSKRGIGKILNLEEFTDFVVSHCMLEVDAQPTRSGRVINAIKALIKMWGDNPDLDSTEEEESIEEEEELDAEEEAAIKASKYGNPIDFQPEDFLKQTPLGLLLGPPYPGPEITGQDRVMALNSRANAMKGVEGAEAEYAALLQDAKATTAETRGEDVVGKGVAEGLREEAVHLRGIADITQEKRVFTETLQNYRRWFWHCGKPLSYIGENYTSRAAAVANRAVRKLRRLRREESARDPASGGPQEATERDLLRVYSQRPWRLLTPPIVRRRLQGLALRDNGVLCMVHGGPSEILHNRLQEMDPDEGPGRRAVRVIKELWADHVRAKGHCLSEMVESCDPMLNRKATFEAFETVWHDAYKWMPERSHYDRSRYRGLEFDGPLCKKTGEMKRASKERQARRLLQEACWSGEELAAEIGEKSTGYAKDLRKMFESLGEDTTRPETHPIVLAIKQKAEEAAAAEAKAEADKIAEEEAEEAAVLAAEEEAEADYERKEKIEEVKSDIDSEEDPEVKSELEARLAALEKEEEEAVVKKADRAAEEKAAEDAKKKADIVAELEAEKIAKAAKEADDRTPEEKMAEEEAEEAAEAASDEARLLGDKGKFDAMVEALIEGEGDVPDDPSMGPVSCLPEEIDKVVKAASKTLVVLYTKQRHIEHAERLERWISMILRARELLAEMVDIPALYNAIADKREAIKKVVDKRMEALMGRMLRKSLLLPRAKMNDPRRPPVSLLEFARMLCKRPWRQLLPCSLIKKLEAYVTVADQVGKGWLRPFSDLNLQSRLVAYINGDVRRAIRDIEKGGKPLIEEVFKPIIHLFLEEGLTLTLTDP